MARVRGQQRCGSQALYIAPTQWCTQGGSGYPISLLLNVASSLLNSARHTITTAKRRGPRVSPRVKLELRVAKSARPRAVSKRVVPQTCSSYSPDCARNDLRWCEIQNFLGEYALADALRARACAPTYSGIAPARQKCSAFLLVAVFALTACNDKDKMCDKQ